MRRMATALFTTGVVGAAGLAGCGSGSPGRNPDDVAEAYFHDLGSRNYAAACELFTDELRRRLGDCAGTLRGHYWNMSTEDRDQLRSLSVRQLPVHGDTVEVSSVDTKVRKKVTDKTGKSRTTYVQAIAVSRAAGGGVTLVKVGDTWRISRARV